MTLFDSDEAMKRWMRTYAARLDAPQARLPEYRKVWLRAQWEQRQAARTRAVRFGFLTEAAIQGLALTALGVLLIKNWTAVEIRSITMQYTLNLWIQKAGHLLLPEWAASMPVYPLPSSWILMLVIPLLTLLMIVWNWQAFHGREA
jgi:hypothetical protein